MPNQSIIILYTLLILLFNATYAFSYNNSTHYYESGQALRESKAQLTKKKDFDFESVPPMFMKQAEGLKGTEYLLWMGNLVKHGKQIRKSQNKIYDNLTKIGTMDSYDDEPARRALNNIFQLHNSVNAYEKDVYDFLNVASVSTMADKGSMTSTLTEILKDIRNNENLAITLANSIKDKAISKKQRLESVIMAKENTKITNRSLELSEDALGFTKWSICIAIIAITITYLSIRLQYIVLLLSQLQSKATECNNYLDNGDIRNGDIAQLSSILSCIITSKQILEHQFNKYKSCILLINVANLVTIFHLQLHTTIRDKIKDDFSNLNIENPTLEEQFNDAKKFLKNPSVKYDS